jgi:copper chaperone CopZ
MKLAVSGMTCHGCASSVTKSLERAAPGSKIAVDLAGGSVEITGVVEEQVARQAIERAGYKVTARLA